MTPKQERAILIFKRSEAEALAFSCLLGVAKSVFYWAKQDKDTEAIELWKTIVRKTRSNWKRACKVAKANREAIKSYGIRPISGKDIWSEDKREPLFHYILDHYLGEDTDDQVVDYIISQYVEYIAFEEIGGEE